MWGLDWFISSTCSCIVSDLKDVRIRLVYFLYLFLYCFRFEGDAEDWTSLFPVPVLVLFQIWIRCGALDWFISCTCSCIVLDLKEMQRIGLVYFLYLFLYCFRFEVDVVDWTGLFPVPVLVLFPIEGDAEDWSGLFPVPVLVLFQIWSRCGGLDWFISCTCSCIVSDWRRCGGLNWFISCTCSCIVSDLKEMWGLDWFISSTCSCIVSDLKEMWGLDWFIFSTCSCIVSDLKEMWGLDWFISCTCSCIVTNLNQMRRIGLVYFLYLFLYCFRFESDAEDWTGLFPVPVLVLFKIWRRCGRLDWFIFSTCSCIVSDLKEMRKIGLVYFLYLFFYSGLEFTLTFLTHNRFHYDSYVLYFTLICLVNHWLI